MCARGWRSAALNPSGAPVLTREFGDNVTAARAENWHALNNIASDALNVLRETRSGDHVDILGSDDFISDVLHFACGRRSLLQNRIASDIEAISQKVAQRLKLY